MWFCDLFCFTGDDDVIIIRLREMLSNLMEVGFADDARKSMCCGSGWSSRKSRAEVGCFEAARSTIFSHNTWDDFS